MGLPTRGFEGMEEYSWVHWPYSQLLQTVAEGTAVLSTGPHQPPRVLPGRWRCSQQHWPCWRWRPLVKWLFTAGEQPLRLWTLAKERPQSNTRQTGGSHGASVCASAGQCFLPRSRGRTVREQGQCCWCPSWVHV